LLDVDLPPLFFLVRDCDIRAVVEARRTFFEARRSREDEFGEMRSVEATARETSADEPCPSR